jgi:hypothetical protein
MGVSGTIFWGWLQTVILLIPIARITDVNNQHPIILILSLPLSIENIPLNYIFQH